MGLASCHGESVRHEVMNVYEALTRNRRSGELDSSYLKYLEIPIVGSVKRRVFCKIGCLIEFQIRSERTVSLYTSFPVLSA